MKTFARFQPAACAIAAILVIFARPVEAAPLSIDQAKAVYSRLAKKFPERKIFYRWQSRVSAMNLLQSETYSGKIHSYFMGMPFNHSTMHGGRGIYVAETLYTSSRFIRGNTEGALIEIAIDAGTPYIDLEDPETLEKLKAAGLTGSTKELAEVEPSLVVRYRQADVNGALKDWWVLKAPRGVRFQKFNPNRFSLDELRSIHEKIGRYGGPDDTRQARQILVSRLTDDQRTKLGWKKTYYYEIGELLEKVLDPVKAGRAPTSEDRRYFQEMLERAEEAAREFARSDVARSRLFEHPNWTSDSLVKFLAALFPPDRSLRPEWVRGWIQLLAKRRAQFVPALQSAPEIGWQMAVVLHGGSARTARERDRAFSLLYRDAGPTAISDLAAYSVSEKVGPASFVDLADTLWKGLGEKEFRALAEPSLKGMLSRFRFSELDANLLRPAFPQIQGAGSVSTNAPDPARFDAFFSRIRKEMQSGQFRRSTHWNEWISEFLSLAPSGDDLRKLEAMVNMRAFAKALRKEAYEKSRTVREFIDFTGSAFDGGYPEYLEMLDETTAGQIERFIQSAPTEDEMLELLKRMNLPESEPFLRVAARFAELSRDRDAFAAKVRALGCRGLLLKR
jgi:hypothetical protein